MSRAFFLAFLVLSASALANKDCREKLDQRSSANKDLSHCTSAWHGYTLQTDREPESCATKLNAFEQASREYHQCLVEAKNAREAERSKGLPY